MHMRISSLSHVVLNALDTLFRAGRVAGAIERGLMPDVRDLDGLGINAASFAAIHRI
jgi:hypothetical protein